MDRDNKFYKVGFFRREGGAEECMTPHSRLPRAIAAAPFARLDGASELFATALLHQYIFPALVEDFFDSFRHVDDLRSWNQVVILLNISVVELFIPK
jgi:hypothetical protein